MVLYGTAHRIGDHVTTAGIIAAEFGDAADPAILAAHCLAAVDPTIAERAREGDFLLAGIDFGTGAAVDSAVLALQAVGFVAVICSSVAPSFDEAAQVYGLPVLICPDAVTIAPGSVVRLDLASGRITDRATGVVYQAAPCDAEMIAAVRSSELLARMRRVVEEEGFDG